MLPPHILLCLLKVNSPDWRRLAKTGAVAGGIVLAAYVYLQHVDLERARADVDKLTLAYQNPRKFARTRTLTVQGPVRVVTRTVEAEGRRETVTEETRGPVFEMMDKSFLTEPVLTENQRTDRWLAGASFNPFHFDRPGDWTALAGYSFRNRVDLLGGATARGSPRLVIVLRF